ncbi:UDP-N-acetylmuramoyl-tripeptide--D-alanyl-D-alanine ligase [Piscirickettsia salmonis]|uniref:UDP-N-acetylmuramoyl-tripeptide--D-alanyl-D- alanine ligase n=1 Tax=Piscirickettsia salmonis TaxID=1238 RepID=UPI003EBBAADD
MKTLRQLAKAINAKYFGDDVAIQAITHDTRDLNVGDIYIALKGDRLDGHDFVGEALARGAVAVIISQVPVELEKQRLPYLLVEDTTLALGQLAKVWRQQFSTKIVAITGSAGKTTTRNILYAILSRAGKTLLPVKNYNNHWGVPLTLLRLRADDDYAVLELGANHAGEIAYTVELVQPEVAVLTNAGASHLAGFGSLEGVAMAKSEIFQEFNKGQGVAILNKEDRFYDFWNNKLKNIDQLSFCSIESQGADVYATNIQMTDQGSSFTLHIFQESMTVTLPLLGRNNINNALAAAAATVALKVNQEDIIKGLATVAPESGRLCLLPAVAGARLIDDTYNASVNAMLSALEVLSMFSGKRVAVLGDMGELGVDEIAYHQQVGESAKNLGIDNVYVVGEKMQSAAHAFGEHAQHFTTKKALVSQLITELNTNRLACGELTILVKGSRAMRMEEVIEELQHHNEDALC